MVLIVIGIVVMGGGALVQHFGWRNCGLAGVLGIGGVMAFVRGRARKRVAFGPLVGATILVLLGGWFVPEREGELSVFRRGETAAKWVRHLDGAGVGGVETAEFIRSTAGMDLGEGSRFHRRVAQAFDRWLERALTELEAEVRSLPDGDLPALGRRADLRATFHRFFPDRTGALRDLERAWFERSRDGLVAEGRRRGSVRDTNTVAWVAGLGAELGPRLYQALEAETKRECLDLVRRARFEEARRRAEAFHETWRGQDATALRSPSLEPWVESHRFLEELARRAGVAKGAKESK